MPLSALTNSTAWTVFKPTDFTNNNKLRPSIGHPAESPSFVSYMLSAASRWRLFFAVNSARLYDYCLATLARAIFIYTVRIVGLRDVRMILVRGVNAPLPPEAKKIMKI